MTARMTTALALTAALIAGCGSDEAPAPTGAIDQIEQQAAQENAQSAAVPAGRPDELRPQPAQPAPIVTPDPSPAVTTGSTIEVGGLTMAVPESWNIQEITKPYRAAQYGVGESGQFVLFTGIGGGIDANINRWIGQVGNPTSPAVRDVVRKDGIVIHTVRMTGTYQGMTMQGDSPAQSGTTFFGAIVEGASTPIQLRLTVEADREDEAAAEWDALIASIVRG